MSLKLTLWLDYKFNYKLINLKVQKNFIYKSIFYFTGVVFSAILNFLFKNYITKSFDFSILGNFTFYISTISMTIIFLSYGYKDSLIFFISKYLMLKKPNKIFSHIKNTIVINSISLFAIFLAIIFASELISSKILDNNFFSLYKYHFFILLLLNSLLAIAIEIVNGFEKIHFSTTIEKFFKLPLKILLAFILINVGFNFNGILLAEIISSILALFLFALFIKKLFKSNNIFITNKIKFNKLEKLERLYIKNTFLNNILANSMNYMEMLLILFYTDYKILGVYSLLKSLSFFVPIILISINSVLKPIIAKLYASNDLGFIKHYFRLSGKIIFVMTIPIFITMYFYNDYIANYLVLEIPGSKTLFITLLFGELINSFKGPVFITLRMMGFTEDVKNIGYKVFIIKFLLFNFFIANFGLIGIGLASILTQFLQALFGSLILYKRTKIHMFDKDYIIHITLSIILISAIFFANLIITDPITNFETAQSHIIALIIVFIPNLFYLIKKFETSNILKNIL